MREISFTIPGKPVSKLRHHTVALNQCNACGKQLWGKSSCTCGSHSAVFVRNVEFSDAKTANYENLVALVAQQAMNGSTERMLGPVRLAVKFYFPIPPSRVKKLKEGEAHLQKPDLDNCQKSVIDGLLRICLNDDCNVCEIAASKHWSMNPRAEVTLVEQ